VEAIAVSDQHPPTSSITSLGEFGLIERISRIVGASAAVVGIGDDAAVIDRPGDSYLLATVDMLVEDVHFRTGRTSPEQLGRRAIEINASDIAAMGGSPGYALVSLALRPQTEVTFVDDLFAGIQAAAAGHGVQVVGGNLTRIDGPVVVDATLLGAVPKEDLVTRRGARVGDVLAVTGTLGDAAAIRRAGDAGLRADDPAIQEWMRKRAVPRARVAEGRALASAHVAGAMIDISDGLSSDLSHLCDASEVGALIDETSLPLSLGTRWAAENMHVAATDLALAGGEDYELLVTISETDLLEARQLGVTLCPIGRVVPRAEGINLRSTDGRRVEIQASGWTHF
jgi:thiamine-monophosphate kinase